MIIKRHILILFLSLLALFNFSACTKTKPSTDLIQGSLDTVSLASSNDDQYQIALVMKTLTNPFFVDMEVGARRAESELDIKLIVKTGAQETSIEQQIQIVEELILQKVDAIVIAPGSSIDLVKVLKKAQDAGIKIVNIDNRLDAAECAKQKLTNVPFISIKNDDAAYLSAKEITSIIKTPSEAVIIEGIQDAENAELRRQGAVKAFSENTNIKVVASQTANWKIDEAYNLAKKLFNEYPNTKLVFCANDMMALGVIQYLKEADNKDVLLSGFDNLEDMQTEIKEGWAVASIDQQADLQGYTGIITAVKMIKGEQVDAETYVTVKIITKKSLEK